MPDAFADFLKTAVDEKLTVRTAEEKGYRHVLDIDQGTLYDLRADYSRMVKEEGYKLGQPRSISPEKGKEQDTGLYEPLPQSQKKNLLKKFKSWWRSKP